ncbi:MAG TPA: 2-oxo acid dehydrogenase subunit E2, partial [Planctomycetaceae bacterium]|nr:2-oxo acid dehydrogenase subunit E2 [Planctomycetaceae bacterium]
TPPPANPDPEIPSPNKPGPDLPSPKLPGREIPNPSPSEPEIGPSEPPMGEPGSPTFAAPLPGSRLSSPSRRFGSGESRRRISPRAFRIAGELDVDWRDLPGSGRGGRIREGDVRAAVATLVRAPGMSLATGPPGSTASAASLALRRTIAARMTAGAQTTAPVTLTTTADATNLVSLRTQFKSSATTATVVPSYLAFITKLAARSLTEHPQLNQQWIDGRIETPDGIHIAVAVDTPAGLLAPVVRDVPALGVIEIAKCLHELTSRAESGHLRPAELTGGTFTISNLGAYGIDAFTPILNVPQCAILGLGRIERRPAVVDDQIVPRDQLTLSLTFDHRIVDGAPAARFLATLRQAIENPGPWLVL